MIHYMLTGHGHRAGVVSSPYFDGLQRQGVVVGSMGTGVCMCIDDSLQCWTWLVLVTVCLLGLKSCE